MFRTFYMAIYFILYLISLTPKKFTLNKLKEQNNLIEYENLISNITYHWGKKTFDASGSTLEVEGLENIPEGPIVVISNHQGFFDIPVLLFAIHKPISFIAKIELATIPIFGTWMKLIKCIFIDRDNPRQSLKAINSGVNLLKEGHSMVIFPEGTRSKGSTMGEFKKGSLRLATKAKVPILPVTIKGTYKILEDNNKRIKPSKVKVVISKPIYTDNLSKEEESMLSDQVYDIVNSNL
ncbi:1-acyl-sn-glycerol-3-phosphate acyltransferase [Lutibacter sp. B2]|nr:1-acyl-sn-glycerol-3-phosphate acyltransferase [Lutibacter sp. B2]